MLQQEFLNELFKLCFYKREVLESVVQYLKYQYIPVEYREYKLILQSISDQFKETGELPSLGIVSQSYYKSVEVQEIIQDIRDTEVRDVSPILTTLEEYIKDTIMVSLFNDVKDLANNDKMKEAKELFTKGSQEFSEFSISKNTSCFLKLIADFPEMVKRKKEKIENGEDRTEKVPFGILPLDMLTDGGVDIADTALFIMRSGVGKSTALKWIGMNACRMGYNVLHIQAEGTKDEAYDKYTQAWSGTSYNEAKWAKFSDSQMRRMNKVMKDLKSRNRDLYIHAFEQFNTVTMSDIQDVVILYEKERGCFPDLVIIDSLDLINPGDGRRYGPNDTKAVMQATAKKMKNLATKFKTRVVTATQTSEIPFEKWNSLDYNITRSDAMGDKNIANAFSYVISGNQTVAERKNNTMRLFIDKFRNYNLQDACYPIATNYNKGQFFNLARTKSLFDNIYGESK